MPAIATVSNGSSPTTQLSWPGGTSNTVVRTQRELTTVIHPDGEPSAQYEPDVPHGAGWRPNYAGPPTPSPFLDAVEPNVSSGERRLFI